MRSLLCCTVACCLALVTAVGCSNDAGAEDDAKQGPAFRNGKGIDMSGVKLNKGRRSAKTAPHASQQQAPTHQQQ